MSKNVHIWKRNRASEKYHLFPVVIHGHRFNQIKSACEDVVLQPFHLESKNPALEKKCQQCQRIDKLLS